MVLDQKLRCERSASVLRYGRRVIQLVVGECADCIRAAAWPEGQRGWLTGARDPIVGKSLGLMHSRVANPWTIATLADEVGISRSALVERFTRYLSEPPMAYLTRWRLQLAARSLEKTSRGVAEIAGDVGYESEAAFNRAFKRELGRPPGRHRSDHRRSRALRTREPIPMLDRA
jgi:transcriptional regulator GlxA family with amidase domain